MPLDVPWIDLFGHGSVICTIGKQYRHQLALTLDGAPVCQDLRNLPIGDIDGFHTPINELHAQPLSHILYPYFPEIVNNKINNSSNFFPRLFLDVYKMLARCFNRSPKRSFAANY
jgi:hypothetical protein